VVRSGLKYNTFYMERLNSCQRDEREKRSQDESIVEV
jgi:hypothetical protein